MKKKKKPDEKSDKEKAYEERYANYITSYKTIKTSLKSIIRNKSNIEKINEVVYRMNLIITHTYQFLKLYCLHTFRNEGCIPIINEQLINTIMKILCNKHTSGRKPSEEVKILRKQLTKFYNDEYKQLLPEKIQVSLTNLSQILEYEKTNIITCINNHISEHFEQCLNRYVNVLVDKNTNIDYIKHMKNYNLNNDINYYLNGGSTIINSKNVPNNMKLSKTLIKKMVSAYTKDLNRLKRDLMLNENKCNIKYNKIKVQIRKNIIHYDFNSYIKNTLDIGLNTIYSKIDNLKKYNCSNDFNDFINEKSDIEELLDNDFKEYLKEFNKKRIEKLINDVQAGNITNNYTKSIERKLINKYMKISIYKKLDNDPLILLPVLIKINLELEENGFKIMTAFPLRRSIMPKYISIDTTTLIYILFTKDMNKRKALSNVKQMQNEIWKIFFKTNMQVFKNKKYQFNCQIETDGVGCSILMIRKDLYNPNKNMKIKHMSKPRNFRSESYVDELTEKEKELFSKMKNAAIDPGKCDLLYATNGETKITQKSNGKLTHKTVTFRYTQKSRNKETLKTKYNNIREDDKSETYIKCKYMDDIMKYDSNENKSFVLYLQNKGYIETAKYMETHKSVKELEAILSNVNSKSCNYENTKEYIKVKNIINLNVTNYYKKDLYRKLKWFSFINKQKSESRMINEFKKIFGKPEETAVFFGNYGGGNLKHTEPTKGKGLRKIFRNAGYRVFLVEEYNTTKKNFVTGLDNEKFMKRRNPRPYKQGVKLVHGLLRSKTVPTNMPMTTRHILVNRNLNGSMNILKKVRCILTNTPLPPFLTR